MKRKLIPIAILVIGLIGAIAYEPSVEQPLQETVKVAEKHTEESKPVEIKTTGNTEVIYESSKTTYKPARETEVKAKSSKTEVTSEPPKSIITEVKPEPVVEEKTLEETLTEQGYVIVYERPQSEMEIYCREDMTLEEWWEMNPPDDGVYDDWDDENNSPDII